MLLTLEAPFWLAGLWPGAGPPGPPPSSQGVNLRQGGVNTLIFEVTATADGAQTFGITHGENQVVQEIYLTPLLPQFYLSGWYISANVFNQITLTKANAVGSGTTAPQLLVIVKRPQFF